MTSFSTNISGYADRITDKTKDILKRQIFEIEKWASTPIIVNAVKEQNASGLTLDEIKAIDKEWVAGERNELVVSLQTNPVGMFLRKKVQSNKGLYTEAFLCEKEGAVVGEYPKTSDYWQGDEKKFTESFNAGNGKVYTGPLLYDESTKSFSIQISVPVKDKNETIGVLIVGIRNIR